MEPPLGLIVMNIIGAFIVTKTTISYSYIMNVYITLLIASLSSSQVSVFIFTLFRICTITAVMLKAGVNALL